MATPTQTQGQNQGITQEEFANFQGWLHSRAGIKLSQEKRALVCGRLSKRLREHGMTRYGDYFQLLLSHSPQGVGEAEIALNLLTTNETYFFREPKHFEVLRDQILPGASRDRPFRVWSAACSTGEEPYTLAMVLAEARGALPWEIIASDINSSVLAQAAQGCYPLERARGISEGLLRKYCLKGVRSQQGSFLIDRALRERVRFLQINLNQNLPSLGEVDVIFLRNVMIYFDATTKAQVVERLLARLRPGGYFIVGHSETLHGQLDGLATIAPTVYQKKRR